MSVRVRVRVRVRVSVRVRVRVRGRDYHELRRVARYLQAAGARRLTIALVHDLLDVLALVRVRVRIRVRVTVSKP